MIKEFYKIIEKFDDEIKNRFQNLCDIVEQSSLGQAEAKVWAKLPSFYVNEKFVRIIPFKDHINIEASAIVDHAKELADYKITPKGMLQIYNNQLIPKEVLKKIVAESIL